MRTLIILFVMAFAITQANAQAVRGIWEAGKWIAKGAAKAKTGTAAGTSTGKVTGAVGGATNDVVAATKGSQAATDSAKELREARNIAAKEGAKFYHEHCNSSDKRYQTKNCAAYKGTRETARLPRAPDKARRK